MGAWADVLEQSFLPQVKDSTPFSHLSFCELPWMSQYSYKKKSGIVLLFFFAATIYFNVLQSDCRLGV